jgi:hypothetical protein
MTDKRRDVNACEFFELTTELFDCEQLGISTHDWPRFTRRYDTMIIDQRADRDGMTDSASRCYIVTSVVDYIVGTER